MSFEPSFSPMAHRRVLLIGSDRLAAATMRDLVDADAHVRWFSQNADVAEDIWMTGRPGHVELSFRDLNLRDFADAEAVITTASEPSARRVSEQARAAGRPVNVIGRPDLSTFALEGAAGATDEADASPLQKARAWLSSHLPGAAPFCG